MAVTFRKLRKMLEKDHVTREELPNRVKSRTPSWYIKPPLNKSAVAQLYSDSDTMSFRDLEHICTALHYDVKKAFEFVSEEEREIIQKEYKEKLRTEASKNQLPKTKPEPSNTYVWGQSIEGIKPGDYLLMGEYPYGKNGEKKPICWIVMEIAEDRLFLISRYVIDVMQYHTANKRMPWDRSSIRSWLNTQFVTEALSPEEQGYLLPTRIPYNDQFCTDKVFLLGFADLNKYWPTPSYLKDVLKRNRQDGVPYAQRKATLTPYAKTKEYVDPLAIEYVNHHIYNYLLRDTVNNKIGAVVKKVAKASIRPPYGFYSMPNTMPGGIRPAMWIKR